MSDQNEFALVPNPYEVNDQTKNLVNNQHLSDVTFLVGDEKRLIYAHRFVLALGSPVFERMFFGELKMDCTKPIEIPDLTATGFLCMIKYIYGFKIDEIALSNSAECLRAGDKYLVHHLTKNLSNKVKLSMNNANCCLIYDQLIQIPTEASFLDSIEMMIMKNTKIAFASDQFVKINRNTLIKILKLKYLEIDEIEIMKACLRWINEELKRENCDSTLNKQRALFQPIKGLIRFTDLTIDELMKFHEIECLLTDEEVGSLFMHLSNKSRPFKIQYEFAGRNSRTFKLFSKCDMLALSPNPIVMLLNVSQKLLIHSIHTSLKPEAYSLTFSAKENNKVMDLVYSMSICQKKWRIDFGEPMRVLPGSATYEITLKFKTSGLEYSLLSNRSKFEFRNNQQSVIFDLIFDSYHCIEQIEFNLE